jgi:hypothetical protein
LQMEKIIISTPLATEKILVATLLVIGKIS